MRKASIWLQVTLAIGLVLSSGLFDRKLQGNELSHMNAPIPGILGSEESADLSLLDTRTTVHASESSNKIIEKPYSAFRRTLTPIQDADFGINTPKGRLSRVKLNKTYGKLPISFEVNQGQTDQQVKFLSRGYGRTIFLTSTETVVSLLKPLTHSYQNELGLKPIKAGTEVSHAFENVVLRIKFVDANPQPQIEAVQELPGKVNYLIGNAPHQWHTNIPLFAKVKYGQVYPGVDLIYYGNQQQLEYDFIISPGANPESMLFTVEGVDKLEIDAHGNLVLYTATGQVRMAKPLIYQEASGLRHEISGGYVLTEKYQVGFQVGDYDRSKPLIIDPTLEYSTYLGGSKWDRGLAIAMDNQGCPYVTGNTESTNFPGTTGGSPHSGGVTDVFVTKLKADGSALVYSTYLGGSGSEVGLGIAVDTTGNAYVTGGTNSPDFVGTAGKTLRNFPSGDEDSGDAFLLKLNASGSAPVYATYLGGGSFDDGNSVAVDNAGNAYVTGSTWSNDFVGVTGNSIQPANGGGIDAFLLKVNAAGSALVYSTYLGGYGEDGGYHVTVDRDGNAYVTGSTTSSNFPGTKNSPIQASQKNPVQGTINGSSDAFVTKSNAAGSALVYSTYLGGSGGEAGQGIAVDEGFNAYVSGNTNSPDFPTTLTNLSVYGGGSSDGFVTKLNLDGSAHVYSVYLGGSGQDVAGGIVLDLMDGIVYVTGFTNSTNFPKAAGSPIQPNYGGGVFDAFVAKLDAKGYDVTFSTYLGGNDYDAGYGIVLDTGGNAIVVGDTASTDFPGTTGSSIKATQKNPAQGTPGGEIDAFIAKIAGLRQKIRVPVRICAVAGSPAAGDPNMDNILLQRLQRLSDNSWAKGAFITFESAMPANTNAHFPVIADPNPSPGQPGDILDALVSNTELKEASDNCDKAWKALSLNPSPQGPVLVNLGHYVNAQGNQSTTAGWGTPKLSGGGGFCKDLGSIFSNDGAYAGVIDNSFYPGGDPHGALPAHELGHVLFLGHGNGLDDEINGVYNGVYDGFCDEDENDNATPFSLMSPAPGNENITPTQAKTARAVARVTSGATTSASKAQPADTLSDHQTDPSHDVPDESVDIVSVGIVENIAKGTTLFYHSLFGIIPIPGNRRYLIFADLDGNPLSGGSASTLGFQTAFEGAEIVTRVTVTPDSLGEFRVATPTLWRFEAGAFVEISDPRIQASVTTMFEAESGVALSDVVSIHLPSTILGMTITQARIQGIAEQLTTGQLDRLPDTPLGGGLNISLIPPEYPECEVTPAQVHPGEQVTVEASGLLAGQLARVFLGDQLVAETTIGSDGNAITNFIVPYPVRIGLRLISVAVAGTALSAGNLVEILEDTTPPQVTITTPTANAAIQDGVTLAAEASDLGGIASVSFYVREMGGTNGIPLIGTLNGATGRWEYNFDTTKLPDGYYVILAKAVDTGGNEGWSALVPFSIRNWAIVKLLPSTTSNKAGRTMPVKFAIRMAPSVDPKQPFVYNEDLAIKIYKSLNPGNILQTSLYGSNSTDYRIDRASELYITNFKTLTTPAEYVVEIWRINKNWKVGSFTFKTVK